MTVNTGEFSWASVGPIATVWARVAPFRPRQLRSTHECRSYIKLINGDWLASLSLCDILALIVESDAKQAITIEWWPYLLP
jgi:hypothetical protein